MKLEAGSVPDRFLPLRFKTSDQLPFLQLRLTGCLLVVPTLSALKQDRVGTWPLTLTWASIPALSWPAVQEQQPGAVRLFIDILRTSFVLPAPRRVSWEEHGRKSWSGAFPQRLARKAPLFRRNKPTTCMLEAVKASGASSNWSPTCLVSFLHSENDAEEITAFSGKTVSYWKIKDGHQI